MHPASHLLPVPYHSFLISYPTLPCPVLCVHFLAFLFVDFHSSGSEPCASIIFIIFFSFFSLTQNNPALTAFLVPNPGVSHTPTGLSALIFILAVIP